MQDHASLLSFASNDIYMLRMPEVEKRCGLSRAHIYRLINLGQFPKQSKIGSRAVAWSSRDIDNWIQQRIDESQSGL